MEKPDYVPIQIWNAAIFMLNAWAEDDIKFARDISGNLKRLLFDGPHQTYASDLVATWKRIIAALDPYDCRLEEDDRGQTYRLFLDDLATLTRAINPNMRRALDDAESRLERIAKMARSLAHEWEDLTELREHNGIEWDGGSEYEILTEWANDSHCRIERENWRDFPEISDLLDRIGHAAEFYPIRPPRFHEYAEIGDGGVSGLQDASSLVRFFDARIVDRNFYPEGFKVGDTDMARLLSALLRRDVSRNAVISARKVNPIVNQY